MHLRGFQLPSSTFPRALAQFVLKLAQGEDPLSFLLGRAHAHALGATFLDPVALLWGLLYQSLISI